VQFHARDEKMPSLTEVLDSTIDATWKSPAQTGLAEQSKFAIDYAVLEKLQSLSTSADVTPEVKGIVQAELQKLRTYATDQSKSANTPEAKGFYSSAFGGGGGNGGGGAAAGAAGRGGAAAPAAAPAGGPRGNRQDHNQLPAGPPI